MHGIANIVADATPDFYLEEHQALRKYGIQPYFALPHVHSSRTGRAVDPQGSYMGPMNGFFSTAWVAFAA